MKKITNIYGQSFWYPQLAILCNNILSWLKKLFSLLHMVRLTFYFSAIYWQLSVNINLPHHSTQIQVLNCGHWSHPALSSNTISTFYIWHCVLEKNTEDDLQNIFLKTLWFLDGKWVPPCLLASVFHGFLQVQQNNSVPHEGFSKVSINSCRCCRTHLEFCPRPWLAVREESVCAPLPGTGHHPLHHPASNL